MPLVSLCADCWEFSKKGIVICYIQEDLWRNKLHTHSLRAAGSQLRLLLCTSQHVLCGWEHLH